MSILAKGLLGIKALAEHAAKMAEESDLASLESKAKGMIDLEKARQLFDRQAQSISLQNAAIDQLQQRVSNLESLCSRLEARLSPSPPISAPVNTGGWVDPPPKSKR